MKSVLIAIVLILGFSIGAFAEPDLAINQPLASDVLKARQPLKIAWQSIYNEQVSYTVSYSKDGERFDELIASNVSAKECEWTPGSDVELRGWVKVKAFSAIGTVLAENVIEVRFMPETSIIVSKADQKVFQFENGELKNVFICSTALPKYDLDPGVYKVYSRQPRHWSKKYEVWMDHSLFFHEGYALHATTMVHQLGRPASHGCVRLRPRDASILFDQVKVGTPVIVLPKTQPCGYLLEQAKKPGGNVVAQGLQ